MGTAGQAEQACVWFHPSASDAPSGSRRVPIVHEVGTGVRRRPYPVQRRSSISVCAMTGSFYYIGLTNHFGSSYSVHMMKITKSKLSLKIHQIAHKA